MKEFLTVLQRCKLFDGLDAQEIDSAIHCLNATHKQYNKGNVILQQGDMSTQIGIVLSGSVQVIRTNYINGTQNIVATISQSNTFAEVFACAEIPLPVTVVCNSNCDILLIDCKRLTTTCHNSCKHHSKLIFNLLKTMANNNLRLQQKIEITSHRTTRDKLLAYLYACADRQHSNTVTIPYNRQQLAEYLNVDRSGLSVEISKLIKDKTLTCTKNKFILNKIE